MLPFPIFLFLLFGATLLTPLPLVLVGSFKISTLQSFEWSTVPASIPDLQPSEAAAFISILAPILPTQCDPNSMHVTNSTIPHPFVHETNDHTTGTAVLLVVSLAILNCLVYKLLVNKSNETHDAETQSEQPTMSLPSTPAAPPPQESMHHHTPEVKEKSPPFFLVDTAKPISGFLEHENLLHLVKDPSTPSFEAMIPYHTPAPLVQSLPFSVLLSEFSLDNSEKTTDGDSTLPSLFALDAPSVSVVQSTTGEALSTLSVDSAVRIEDLDVEPPENTLMDTEAAKETGILHLDSELTGNGELLDNSMPPPAIEEDRELDADEQDVFLYQQLKSESDGDETFDYEEVDCTVEEPTPPTSAAEDQALPSPHLLRPLLGSRGYSFDYFPSSSVKKCAAEEISARYALDDIQVGTKGQIKGETSVTRCISADDFSYMFETTTGNDAYDFTVSDHPSSIFQDDIIDDTAHKQVTLLRADAPIFKPRSSVMNEIASLDELPPPVSVGLKASIHAPQNEGVVSQTQGCVVSESMDSTRQACAPPTTTNTPELPVETGSFQVSIHVSEEPESSGSVPPTRSPSPGVSDGLCASIHAPPNPSNGTQSGLYASIHAPARCPPNQSSQLPYKHQTDVPNWAAICSAQNSSSSSASGGNNFQAQRGNSPDPAPPYGDASEPPATTRCAARDKQGGFVDNSDGSLVHVDDQEGTTGSGETDSMSGEADDPNEQDFTKPSRRSRRRGRPRRPRQKVPYVPPPRMRNLTEHPVVDDVLARGQTANNALAAPLSSLHYAHPPPSLPHLPTLAPGPMIPPNGIMHEQFGRHPHYHPHSPYAAPIPGFQPPSPHDPRFYPVGPHP